MALLCYYARHSVMSENHHYPETPKYIRTKTVYSYVQYSPVLKWTSNWCLGIRGSSCQMRSPEEQPAIYLMTAGYRQSLPNWIEKEHSHKHGEQSHPSSFFLHRRRQAHPRSFAFVSWGRRGRFKGLRVFQILHRFGVLQKLRENEPWLLDTYR